MWTESSFTEHSSNGMVFSVGAMRGGYFSSMAPPAGIGLAVRNMRVYLVGKPPASLDYVSWPDFITAGSVVYTVILPLL